MAVVGSATVHSISGGEDAEGHRAYTVNYLVETSSLADGPAIVHAASGIPARNQTYNPTANELDLIAFAKSISSRRHGGEQSLQWIVTVQFDTKPIASENAQQEWTNPIATPVDWSGSGLIYQRAADKDKNGDLIANAAGEGLLDPPVMADDARPSIRAVRNLASLDLQTWSDFSFAVNSATFLGFDPRTVRMNPVSWDAAYYVKQVGGTGVVSKYYRCTFEFAINFDNWKAKPLNAGLRQKVAGKTKRILETDINPTTGQPRPVDRPVPLNVDGTVMTDTDLAAADPNFLEFDIYKEKDFNTLGLGTP